MSSVTPSRCHRPRTASLTTQARNSSTGALFALLAFAISWAMYIPLALATLRSGTLFRQLRIWRVGIWWYLIAVLLPAGLWLAGRSLDALLGRSYTVESVATDPDLAPYLAGFLIGAFVYTFGRGAGLACLWAAAAATTLLHPDRRLDHRSAVALWHVPTFIVQGHTGRDLMPLVVSPIAASVLFTWVYNSSGGSLLLVWLFHTASTITGYLLGELPTVTDEPVGVAAAVVAVLVAGPTHLSRSRPRQRLSGTPAPQLHHGPLPDGQPLWPCRARVILAVTRFASHDQCNGASWP